MDERERKGWERLWLMITVASIEICFLVVGRMWEKGWERKGFDFINTSVTVALHIGNGLQPQRKVTEWNCRKKKHGKNPNCFEWDWNFFLGNWNMLFCILLLALSVVDVDTAPTVNLFCCYLLHNYPKSFPYCLTRPVRISWARRRSFRTHFLRRKTRGD